MAQMTLPAAGGCRCGATRFEVTLPPLLTAACHCTGCQRMTGSAFSLSVAIPAEGFRVTVGRPVPGGATPHIGHFFCPACMSWIFTRPKGFDQFVNVRPTMLDDVEWFVPFIETFRSEALPWARTPARHSFDAFPPMEMYAALVQEYAEVEGRA